MPKNFQTSQYDEPIAFDGHVDVEVDGETYRIEIERAHMEEDTGKSLHVGGSTGRIHGADFSLVDYNRAGIPLIEIVTRTIEVPGDKAPAVARAYVSYVRDLIGGLGVSDVTHGPGFAARRRQPLAQAHRARRRWARARRPRTSTRSGRVERAVRYEISRHAGILDAGGSVLQETRHFHEDTGTTSSGREKSDADDYRYFPEPDLAPVSPSREWVEELRGTLPEPPAVRRARLQSDWGFTRPRDARHDRRRRARSSSPRRSRPAPAHRPLASGGSARWHGWPTLGVLDSRGCGITPAQVAEIEALIDAGRINDKLARSVFDGVIAGEGTPEEVIVGRQLEVVSDDGALGEAVDRAIAGDPDAAQKIRDGKQAAAGALIGAVMKEMRGQADAGRVRELILEKLT